MKLKKNHESAFEITAPIIFNKKNKQATVSIPKKQLSPHLKKELSNSKKMRFTIQGFK